jgi:hypothetical protein
MKGALLEGAIVFSVIERARWTTQSSFCSSRIAPTTRVIVSSLEKMSMTSVRRLISPLRRSSGWRCAARAGAPWGSS